MQLGTGIEEPGKNQDLHDAVGVKGEFRVALLVSEEPVEFQFVVDLAEDDVPVVFPVGSAPVEQLVFLDFEVQVLALLALLVHLLRQVLEMGDGVIVFLGQNVQVAEILIDLGL